MGHRNVSGGNVCVVHRRSLWCSELGKDGMCRVAMCVWCIGGEYGAASCVGIGMCRVAVWVWCIAGEYGAGSCARDRNVPSGSEGVVHRR